MISQRASDIISPDSSLRPSKPVSRDDLVEGQEYYIQGIPVDKEYSGKQIGIFIGRRNTYLYNNTKWVAEFDVRNIGEYSAFGTGTRYFNEHNSSIFYLPVATIIQNERRKNRDNLMIKDLDDLRKTMSSLPEDIVNYTEPYITGNDKYGIHNQKLYPRACKYNAWMDG